MAGLKGQDRLPAGTPARLRRSQNRLASTDAAFGSNSAIGLDANGEVVIRTDGNTIEQSATGIKVTDATETQRGSVLQQGLVADVAALTDNSGGTSGAGTIAAITEANNAGSADFAETRNAIATLAAYCTNLENKINELLASQKTAGQMNTT